MADSSSMSRRTVLKGLGVAAGSAALGVAPSPPAEGALFKPSGRCYIYLDHAARNRASTGPTPLGAQWVVGALLVVDPRLPRQILRRAKRHRLSSEKLSMPEVKARLASSEFKQYFYRRLGMPRRRLLKKAPVVELYSIRASQSVLSVPRERVGLFQLRMIQALLEACDPWRFREVFVYHLASLRVREGLARGAPPGGPSPEGDEAGRLGARSCLDSPNRDGGGSPGRRRHPGGGLRHVRLLSEVSARQREVVQHDPASDSPGDQRSEPTAVVRDLKVGGNERRLPS